MKIYTRSGDDGETGLIGPGRVSKDAPRVEAYGSVDELNAALGVARAHDDAGWLGTELETVQTNLFRIGADLADPSGAAMSAQRLGDEDVRELETWIDRLEEAVPPLTNFVLPAGTRLGAQLHLARTVCRRAERRVVALARKEKVDAIVVRYLNRLADLLFVMARWSNHKAGAGEALWQGGPSAQS